MLSNDALSNWLPSREKTTLVTPWECARSRRRKHWPVLTRQTWNSKDIHQVWAIGHCRTSNKIHNLISFIILWATISTKPICNIYRHLTLDTGDNKPQITKVNKFFKSHNLSVTYIHKKGLPCPPKEKKATPMVTLTLQTVSFCIKMIYAQPIKLERHSKKHEGKRGPLYKMTWNSTVNFYHFYTWY